MIKTLNHFLFAIQAAASHDIVTYFSSEIEKYKQYWEKYHMDCSSNPLYNSSPYACDQQTFFLTDNEQVTIRWDVDLLYQIAASSTQIEFLSLREFEEIIESALLYSSDEFSYIEKYITPIHNHVYSPILLMNFHPLYETIILDGRHRYIEYKKFYPTASIPVYILDDQQCYNCILHKNELLAYIIMHNIAEMNNYIFDGIYPNIMDIGYYLD